MLDAVDRLQRYVGDQTRDGFEGDEVLQDAVIRQLEILGEAASRVSPELRNSVPEIPWAKVIGTRHRLIHGYLSVDLEVVWHTATHHVPRLRPYLEKAIGGLKG
jgi:uncharacterized protein with HEPN domain